MILTISPESSEKGTLLMLNSIILATASKSASLQLAAMSGELAISSTRT